MTTNNIKAFLDHNHIPYFMDHGNIVVYFDYAGNDKEYYKMVDYKTGLIRHLTEEYHLAYYNSFAGITAYTTIYCDGKKPRVYIEPSCNDVDFVDFLMEVLA